MYPEEFSKAYIAYKKNKLLKDKAATSDNWWLLDPGCAFKLNLNGRDYPFLVNVIPKILDLDEA